MTLNIHWHTSEEMPEVADKSVKLFIGGSLHLGEGVGWPQYARLFENVYVKQCGRVLRDDGFFVSIQTDPYRDGVVFEKNHLTLALMLRSGFKLVDMKIWERNAANMFQLPFSQVMVFTKKSGPCRPSFSNEDYRKGVWRFPSGSNSLNYFPEGLCRVLVQTFTKEGDTILDCFCGSGLILAIASAMRRRAIGFEINQDMCSVIEANERLYASELL